MFYSLGSILHHSREFYKRNLKYFVKKKIKDLEAKIAEVKKRFPYHSIQPYIINELEDLDEQLDKLLKQIG